MVPAGERALGAWRDPRFVCSVAEPWFLSPGGNGAGNGLLVPWASPLCSTALWHQLPPRWVLPGRAPAPPSLRLSPRFSSTAPSRSFRSPTWLCLLLLHLFLRSPQIKIKQPTTPRLFFFFKYPYINDIKGGRHTHQLPFRFCPALLVLGVPRSKGFVPGRGSMSRLSM